MSFLRTFSMNGLFRSLRTKIILGVSLILVLVTGTFTYYETVTRVGFYFQKQEERAFDISAAVMKGIEYPMLDGEMEDVQAILEKIGQLEGLEVVKLIDLFGTIRYSTDPASINEVNESEITLNALRGREIIKGLERYKGKKVYSHAIPISNEKACYKCHGDGKDYLGVLTVGINWGPIEERIRGIRNREIIVSVISLVIVAFFLIRWLSRHITRPILRVTEFAEEVSRGNLDARLDLGEKARCWELAQCDKTNCPAHEEPSVMCWFLNGTLCKGEPCGQFPEKVEGCQKCSVYKKNVGDEIHQLGHSLVHMLRNMREMYEKIASFSRDLELQVAKRTEELEQKTEELEQANKELKKLDELRSAFLANMSHELRTPLNSIIGYTDLLLDRVDGEINEEQEKSLTKVHNNGRNLLRLINDILDMSRIESERVELDLGAVDVRDVIKEVVSALEPMLNNKGLTLEVDFDERLPLAYADQDKVRQVVTNLLDNAIKFTREGRIAVSAKPSEREIEASQPPQLVEVCVSDTGIGIRQEDIGKLFGKFRPLDISATRPYKGVGLGLSICKGLIEIQNGSIWVESVYGEGTTFCFTLPAMKGAFEGALKPLRQDYLEGEVLKPENAVKGTPEVTVLVVDDDRDHVEFISKILKERGYEVTKAYDGGEALESVKRSRPFLIVLDLMMPRIGGFEVIEHLKADEHTRGIPIIVVTGRELTRVETELLQGKADRIIKKGFLGAQDILEAVGYTLERLGHT